MGEPYKQEFGSHAACGIDGGKCNWKLIHSIEEKTRYIIIHECQKCGRMYAGPVSKEFTGPSKSDIREANKVAGALLETGRQAGRQAGML